MKYQVNAPKSATAVGKLECNPNGQFAFVEYGTGLPIARAVADLLSQADAEHSKTRA
ncbi:hypothetical protein ACFU6O_24005 [Streptomyces albidoflavus]